MNFEMHAVEQKHHCILYLILSFLLLILSKHRCKLDLGSDLFNDKKGQIRLEAMSDIGKKEVLDPYYSPEVCKLFCSRAKFFIIFYRGPLI